MLSVIVPYRNEEMLGFTVQRLHETIKIPYEIILVDDGSDAPGEIPPGVTNIRFEKPYGAQFARHKGIEAAQFDTVFIIDAHMNFWDDDWAERLVDYNKSNPTHVGCAITLGLEPGRMEMEKAQGRYMGAHVIPRETRDEPDLHYIHARRILVDRWNHRKGPGEVGCIMGGAYIMSRKWYLETLLSPWAELYSWGYLEGNISIPNYLLGGLNICLDIEVGHMFRPSSPFQAYIHAILFNELYLAHVVIPDEKERDELIAHLELPDDAITQEAWRLLDRSIHRYYRDYLIENGVRTWEEYKTEWMDPEREY